MTAQTRPYPRPPSFIAAYVEALGPELTVMFLLRFGGAELSIGANPKGRSRLEALIGNDRAKALARHGAITQKRVPLAKPWIAACLRAQGHPTAEIARRLHVTDVSVRRWLKREAGRHER